MCMHDAPVTGLVSQDSADAEGCVVDTRVSPQMVVESRKLGCVYPAEVLQNR
jgi:hypothetical protein